MRRNRTPVVRCKRILIEMDNGNIRDLTGAAADALFQEIVSLTRFRSTFTDALDGIVETLKAATVRPQTRWVVVPKTYFGSKPEKESKP